MKRLYAIFVLSLVAANTGFAQDALTIELRAEKSGFHGPVCIPLNVPKAWAEFKEVEVHGEFGKAALEKMVGQLTMPGIVTESIKAEEGKVRRDLHVIFPEEPVKHWTLTVFFKKVEPRGSHFAWSEKKGEYQELALSSAGNSTPYLRYMDRRYDTSSADARNKSYKVFHHLYGPAGKRLVTNGGFADENIGDPKKLVFPHHRGIMYGFYRCSFGPDLKLHADTWHCPPQNEKKTVANAAHIAHEKTISMEAGPVLGRHRVLLGWYGSDKKPFAEEERELTVYNIKGGTLVEFASRLKTTGGKVRLDGDPQHAGFQFRAHNDVAEKTAKQTYFLHPDGKGELGATQNWDPKTKKGPVDLPWYAMSFVLDDQRYTTCYLNHPSNPKETRFSERDYGRIGGYFQRDITEDDPLIVQYRLWLQNGEMTRDQAAALQAAFASPPKVTVK